MGSSGRGKSAPLSSRFAFTRLGSDSAVFGSAKKEKEKLATTTTTNVEGSAR